MNGIIPRPLRDFFDKNNYGNMTENLLPVVLRTSTSALFVFVFLKNQALRSHHMALTACVALMGIVSRPLLLASMGTFSYYYCITFITQALALKSLSLAAKGAACFAAGYLAYELHDKSLFELKQYFFGHKKILPKDKKSPLIDELQTNKLFLSHTNKNVENQVNRIDEEENKDNNQTNADPHILQATYALNVKAIKNSIFDLSNINNAQKEVKYKISNAKNAKDIKTVEIGTEKITRIDTVKIAKLYHTKMIEQIKGFRTKNEDLAVLSQLSQKITYHQDALKKIADYEKLCLLDWFTCKYFRKLSWNSSFSEAVSNYIFAAVNLRSHEVFIDDERTAGFGRLGTISYVLNGWIGFPELFEMEKNPQKIVEKMTYLQIEANKFKDYPKNDLQNALNILLISKEDPQQLPYCIKQLGKNVFLSAKELEDMQKNPKSMKEKITFLKTKINQIESLEYAMSVLSVLQKNPQEIKKNIEDRIEALTLPMMQLILCQLENNKELLRTALLNQTPFTNVHISLLDPTKHEFDKSGWMHDENVQITDMQTMCKHFQGKTLVCDGTGPRIDQNNIYLPFKFDDIQNKTTTLNTLFMNISVHSNHEKHKTINQEAISYFEQNQFFEGNEVLKNFLNGEKTSYKFAIELGVGLAKEKKVAKTFACASGKDRTGGTTHGVIHNFVSTNMLDKKIEGQNPYSNPHKAGSLAMQVATENEKTFIGLKINPFKTMPGVSLLERLKGGIQSGLALYNARYNGEN